MRELSINVADEKPESPFRVMFDRAWGKISKSRIFLVWELLLWSFIAVHSGFAIFGFHDFVIEFPSSLILFITGMVLTPFFVGIWGYQSRLMSEIHDSTLRLIPVRPIVIVGSQLGAVGWMWLRTFGACIAFGVYMLLQSLPGQSQIHLAYQLANPIFGEAGASYENFIVLFALLCCMNLVIFSMTSAIYLSISQIRFRGSYFLNYFLWLFGLVALIFLPPLMMQFLDNHNYPIYTVDFAIIRAVAGIVVVFLPIFFSYVFIRMSCILVGRRA
jgi:hypothetical protein